jgi:3-oxoacyl-[acyl-carrier protein] reductase
MDLGLKSKIAIVTAASQGLGKAAAISLAQEGAIVVICSRKKQAIERAAKEIHDITDAEIVPVVADVSKPADIKRLVATAKKLFGTIHILVNNAGGPPAGDFLTMPESEWKKGVDLTLMSALRLSRAVLPFMIKQHWGRIITITSIAAKQPINDLIVSSTLRPGIHGFTKVLSNKVAKEHITVNTVCPGNILTNRQKELMTARSASRHISMQRYMALVSKDIPAGRLGKPEEIGDVIAFLASERACYINGVNLLVDGGMAKGIF